MRTGHRRHKGSRPRSQERRHRPRHQRFLFLAARERLGHGSARTGDDDRHGQHAHGHARYRLRAGCAGGPVQAVSGGRAPRRPAAHDQAAVRQRAPEERRSDLSRADRPRRPRQQAGFGFGDEPRLLGHGGHVVQPGMDAAPAQRPGRPRPVLAEPADCLGRVRSGLPLRRRPPHPLQRARRAAGVEPLARLNRPLRAYSPPTHAQYWQRKINRRNGRLGGVCAVHRSPPLGHHRDLRTDRVRSQRVLGRHRQRR